MTYLIQLRDYQNECIETVINEFYSGTNKQLINLPTGSGKTIVMSALAKQLNKKTLILAHREELITQTVEKFELVWPEASIGVCMAERNEVDQQVVVGSIQSCSRSKRLERLKERNFDVIMIDEAHHAAADSYQSVIDALGFRNDPNKLLLGVTATVQRGDKLGLDNTFQKITFSRSISTMIRAGYLSPVTGRKILTNFSLKNIRSYKGDFAINELAEAVNTQERNAFIAEKYKLYGNDRKGIVFGVDVKHCHDLADAFQKQGVLAKAIWGDMDSHDRKTVLRELKNDSIQVAISCGVLTEGFDEPSIQCIAMARPTKSRGLYIQCIGRGLRLWPGKENCLVLDFTDRSHNLDSLMSLGITVPGSLEITERECQEKEEIDRTPKIEILNESDNEFDILGCTRFLWVAIGDDEWSLIDDEKREIIMQPHPDGYKATLYFPDGSSQSIVKTPLPLQYCMGVCEDYARRHLKIGFADASKPWMSSNSQPTQGQIDYLSKNNAYRKDMTRGQAAIEIRKLIAIQNKKRRLVADEPITQMQKYFLIGRGVDITHMTKLQAKHVISMLKQREQIKHSSK
jgi:superfamily II DNA or RNA helicase